MQGYLSSAATGFAKGLAATVVMSAGFSLAQRVGAIRQLPPRKVVRAVSPGLREPDQTQVATIAHYLVGGTAGAAYGVATRRLPAGPVSGALFGVGVWALGYEFVMPRATQMPRAHRDRRSRAIVILLAHLLYGAVLGTLRRR